jgi:hypothetical protein
MEVVVAILVFTAGGLVALATSRLLLSGVLELTFRPWRRERIRRAAGA